MGDVLVFFLRQSLPEELASSLQDVLQLLEQGDFQAIFNYPEVQLLLGHHESHITKDVQLGDFKTWKDYILHRISLVFSKGYEEGRSAPEKPEAYLRYLFFVVAVASLYAFLQTSVTGPPLPFISSKVLLPAEISSKPTSVAKFREELVTTLATDGVAAYRLTPNAELLCLAETILTYPSIQEDIKASAWARIRVHFAHQRLLSEIAPSLQETIYKDIEILSNNLLSPQSDASAVDLRVHFLLERAVIHTYHGLDKKARSDIDLATTERRFEFALTGLLGKRTKFQQKDTSQLVVLAKSSGRDANPIATSEVSQPKNLDLNDDTLLESISFTESPSTARIQEESALPSGLAALDPSNQPLLDPLDSVILLSLASSITNTNPADGLTREETLPYANRVLEGGSSNWQVYTQALLVRSRIEGYKSRTMERGLLQLQAVVDQVIAETTGAENPSKDEKSDAQVTSFLPRAKESESAPITERLKYMFALATPSRWDLESELAARWVHIGGLRSALEIYERLELWAEAALCWAATEKEEKARRIIRRQLFHATSGPNHDETADPEEEKWEGPARDPPPTEAPRLYCILGDIDKDISMYEKAWSVSGNRYARAQRSMGRQYLSQRDYLKAAESYNLSLQINALNHSAWFALGCAYLELQSFKLAVEAFSRCVQLDDEDAEAWSNLAAALLHLRPKSNDPDAENGDDGKRRITNHPRQDALKAFKRAATLKHSNFKIWSNVLAVAASTSPPAYTDIIAAQRNIIDLRGSTEGENCIDIEIFDLLVTHVIQNASQDNTNGSSAGPNITRPGLPRLVNELIEKSIKPLVTGSAQLWIILSTFYLHTNRPFSALEAHEKAWRAVTSQPKWESGSEEQWTKVVEQTIDLVDAYESLGGRERTEGLAAGSGELVAKDWKFKSRSAIRSVMGKGKEYWEDSTGWDRLKEALDGLKGKE